MAFDRRTIAAISVRDPTPAMINEPERHTKFINSRKAYTDMDAFDRIDFNKLASKPCRTAFDCAQFIYIYTIREFMLASTQSDRARFDCFDDIRDGGRPCVIDHLNRVSVSD